MSPWFRFTVKWARTVHLYLTLSALGLLIFFAVTGFMLNHEDWFNTSEPIETQHTATLPIELFSVDKKFEIVEWLRKEQHAVGEASFEPDAETDEGGKIVELREIRVQFKRPGMQVECIIHGRDDDEHKRGDVSITRKTWGLAGLMLDLHRGKDTSRPWKLIIDLVAIVYLVIGVTGIIMWWSLKSRGKYGLAIALLGIAASVAIVLVFELAMLRG
jgi:hypothetical protein